LIAEHTEDAECAEKHSQLSAHSASSVISALQFN